MLTLSHPAHETRIMGVGRPAPCAHLGGGVGGVGHSLEVEHAHLPRLADAVRARDSLLLVLGVGVGVVDDHRVGGLQVEAPPGRAYGQQEQERSAVGGVEALYGRLPVRRQASMATFLRARVCPHAQHMAGLAGQDSRAACGACPMLQVRAVMSRQPLVLWCSGRRLQAHAPLPQSIDTEDDAGAAQDAETRPCVWLACRAWGGLGAGKAQSPSSKTVEPAHAAGPRTWPPGRCRRRCAGSPGVRSGRGAGGRARGARPGRPPAGPGAWSWWRTAAPGGLQHRPGSGATPSPAVGAQWCS